MIVVLDSGVWISALQFGGVPLLAVDRALHSDRIAVCNQIETEVIRVLGEKLGWQQRRARDSLALYLRDALRVTVTGVVRDVCRDPKDDMVLECAVGAHAKLIISGDKDLLAVGAYRGVRVVTAREYITAG